MRAAAQFTRPRTAHLDDPYRLLVVGLAEQRQRTDLAGPGQRHDRRADVQVLADRLVRRLLDIGANLLAKAALPGEVKSQIARLVVRATLQGRRAQYLPQCGMHDVRARVRLARPNPPLAIDRGQHLCAAEQLALLDMYPMHDEALHWTLHIDDLKLNTIADDSARVGVLATGFGVERRLLQDDLDHVAFFGCLSERPVHHNAADLRLGAELGVAGKRSRSHGTQIPVDLHRLSACLFGFGVGFRAILLLLHQPPEARLVNA